MRILSDQSKTSNISLAPKGERVVSRTELRTVDAASLGDMFLRSTMLTCLNTRGFGEETFSGLDHALEVAERELDYVARVTGSRLLAHEWMLYPIVRADEEDYCLMDDYAAQTSDNNHPLKVNMSRHLPAGHMLVALVEQVPHSKLDEHARAAIWEALDEEDYYAMHPVELEPKLHDMRPNQFVAAAGTGQPTIIDIEPRFW